jgi:hypothetical protein
MDVPAPVASPPGAGLLRWLRYHQIVFVLAIAALNLANVVAGAPWWAIWPSLIWGTVLAVHLCIVRSIVVDEEWVNERAMDLREHSYDFDHMKDIERRIVDSDFSVVPPEERRDRKRDK